MGRVVLFLVCRPDLLVKNPKDLGALPPIKASKLKVLAVTGSTPDPTLPDVPPLPTFFPGLDLQPWVSIVGPAGLTAPIAARLNGVLNKASPILPSRSVWRRSGWRRCR